MKNFQFRKATIKDLEIIQNLNNGLLKYEMKMGLDCYRNDWSLSKTSAEYFKDLIENQFVLVAELEKEGVIGYLAGSIYKDDTFSYYDGKTAELENMFICEQFRKFGIGSKLVDFFINWCKANNAKRVFVTATLGNDNTINFYRKNGFKDLNITLRKEL